MISEGRAKRFSNLKSGEQVVDARYTHLLSQAVAQVELPNQEMTRAGRRFFLGISAAITGIAPVQAIPTTAAQWTIFNASQPGGPTYYFEELGEILVSGTPGLGGSCLFCLFQLPASTGAQATGFTVQNAQIGSRSASAALAKSAVTVSTPAAPVWYQLAENSSAVTAAAFSTGYSNGFVKRDIGGAIALPPQYGLGLAVMAPTGTTPLYAPVARWIEVETDNE